MLRNACVGVELCDMVAWKKSGIRILSSWVGLSLPGQAV